MSSWMSEALWKHSTATATFQHIVGDRLAGIVAQRLIRGDGEEGPPAFAGAAEPVAGDLFGLARGGCP